MATTGSQTGIDPTSSQAFANQITKAVLATLTHQADTKQYQRVDGQITINPQSFQIASLQASGTLGTVTANMTPAATQQFLTARGQDKRHLTVGPTKFTNTFSATPQITFGQATQPLQTDISFTPGPADNLVPFLVVPYVAAWHYTSGQVDGFYLGLYAMTAPPAGVTQHYVNWSANGKASRYPSGGTNATWTSSYDLNQAPNLTAQGT